MSLEIVNFCPICGSPVYGRREIEEQEPPMVKRTCSCFLSGQQSQQSQQHQAKNPDPRPKSVLDEANRIETSKKDIRDLMHTK